MSSCEIENSTLGQAEYSHYLPIISTQALPIVPELANYGSLKCHNHTTLCALASLKSTSIPNKATILEQLAQDVLTPSP